MTVSSAPCTPSSPPFQAGDIALANRIVMAPLTRNRALPGRIPGDLQREYYRQRASAGLIVTEASQISPEGQGYLDTPGIYSAEQVVAGAASPTRCMPPAARS